MTDLLARAAGLAPLLREHADTAERERRSPAAVVDALRDARIFDLFVPAAFGGLEIDVATGIQVIEELSAADGSAGWVAMIGATTGIVAAYLPEEATRKVYTPGAITGGVVAPRGRAAQVEGGFRVKGRWPYASGCQHSDWLVAGCLVTVDGKTQSLESGAPDWRIMVLPVRDVEIIDTWHVSGLRGTGSHDMAVGDVFVPEAYSFPIAGKAVHPGPLYTFSMQGLLAVSVAGVALGIGRHAVEEIIALASAKTPTGSPSTLAKWGVAQVEVARAVAALKSGRAFLLETARDIWDTVSAGGHATVEQRALLRLAASNAVSSAVRATDIAYELGGGTSVYESSPLQRCLRDVHAVTQHIMVGAASYESAGRTLLGLELQGPFL